MYSWYPSLTTVEKQRLFNTDNALPTRYCYIHTIAHFLG